MLDFRHFRGSAKSLLLFSATVCLLITVAPAGAVAPDIVDVRTHAPDALIPGSVTCALDGTPPGYLVCTLVTRYYDDESQADLQVELDLTARLQFARFIAAGSRPGFSRAEMKVHGFENVATWWEGNALHGLYFVPANGLEVTVTNAGDASVDTPVVAHVPDKLSAAELLLQGRACRKRRDFDSAREVLGRLRNEYPLSPEARRALRELYFVSTSEKQLAPRNDGVP